MERFCVRILKLFLGWNRQGNFSRKAMDWWHVVSKCLCVPVILVPFGKEGEQIGKHKRVGGSLSTFKG